MQNSKDSEFFVGLFFLFDIYVCKILNTNGTFPKWNLTNASWNCRSGKDWTSKVGNDKELPVLQEREANVANLSFTLKFYRRQRISYNKFKFSWSTDCLEVLITAHECQNLL